jgi:hypothetical protein
MRVDVTKSTRSTWASQRGRGADESGVESWILVGTLRPRFASQRGFADTISAKAGLGEGERGMEERLSVAPGM